MSSPPVVIARTDLRRSVRVVFSSPTKVLTLGLLAVIGIGPLLLGVGVGAFVLGRAFETGVVFDDGVARLEQRVRGTVALAWIVLWLVSVLRGATQAGSLDLPDVLLLGTSLRNVVLGVILGELIRFGVVIVSFGALIGISLALGAGAPWLAIVVPAVVFLLLVSAVPAGFPIGVLLRHLMTTYPPIARLRAPILLALLAGYIGILVTERFEPAILRLVGVLDRTPLAWPGEALLVVLPGLAAELWPIVAALGLTVVALPICIAASTRVAGLHWYHDPTPGSRRLLQLSLSLGSLERALAGRVDRSVRAICLTTLRRTIRAPIRVLYVSYPLLGSIFFVVEILRRGEVPLLLFVLLAMYVVWAAGALVTLNPLGDVGPAVASVVASPVRGRHVMHGYRLAAWLVGLPVAALVVLAAALLGDVTPRNVLLLGLSTMVATMLSPSLALGVGAMFPRFGSVRVTNRREAVMPSKLAFGVYSTVLSVPTTAAVVLSSPLLLEWLTSIADSLLRPVGPEAASVAVWVVRLFLLIPALLSIPLALLAFRFACYRYDRYYLP